MSTLCSLYTLVVVLCVRVYGTVSSLSAPVVQACNSSTYSSLLTIRALVIYDMAALSLVLVVRVCGIVLVV